MQKGGVFTLDMKAPVGTELTHPGIPEMTLVKTSATKLVYSIKQKSEWVVKAILRDEKTPTSKIYREIELQKRAAAHPPLAKRVPQIHNMAWKDDYFFLTMDKMPGRSISDEFGERASNVSAADADKKTYTTSSENIWNQVRGIINELRKIGILYFDVTGYNFMFSDPYVSVIDFGHAEDLNLDILNKHVGSLNTFLQGTNEWITL